jgi:transposase
LYRCQDKLLVHKRALFSFLAGRWRDLFRAGYEVLLYDLTSTYFECDPPESGKRRHGYSRDKRPDCVQVVITLVVTPEGLPLAYEVMAGNTSDKTTLRPFLEKIEQQYGKANRTWVMDRGIPTEEVLREMREASTPVSYLVGTPRGRLNRLEKEFLKQLWAKVRDSLEVKLLPREGELYILARSHGRRQKERAMRRRRLKRLWNRLRELQQQKLTRDDLLLKLGAAKAEAGNAYRLVQVHVPT